MCQRGVRCTMSAVRQPQKKTFVLSPSWVLTGIAGGGGGAGGLGGGAGGSGGNGGLQAEVMRRG
jgi:hypothetical protein